MLTSVVVKIIEVCTRHAWSVIVAGIALALLSGVYSARNFAINSDISALLSPNLEWRKREIAFERAFGRFETNVVVASVLTPEQAGDATAQLAYKLAENKERFRSVTRVNEFFAPYGLLFQDAN